MGFRNLQENLENISTHCVQPFDIKMKFFHVISFAHSVQFFKILFRLKIASRYIFSNFSIVNQSKSMYHVFHYTFHWNYVCYYPRDWFHKNKKIKNKRKIVLSWKFVFRENMWWAVHITKVYQFNCWMKFCDQFWVYIMQIWNILLN